MSIKTFFFVFLVLLITFTVTATALANHGAQTVWGRTPPGLCAGVRFDGERYEDFVNRVYIRQRDKDRQMEGIRDAQRALCDK